MECWTHLVRENLEQELCFFPPSFSFFLYVAGDPEMAVSEIHVALTFPDGPQEPRPPSFPYSLWPLLFPEVVGNPSATAPSSFPLCMIFVVFVSTFAGTPFSRTVVCFDLRPLVTEWSGRGPVPLTRHLFNRH